MGQTVAENPPYPLPRPSGEWRAPAAPEPPPLKRKMRKLSWAIIIFNVLMSIWVVGGIINVAVSNDCGQQAGNSVWNAQQMKDACNGATALGAGAAIFVLLVVTVLVDIILAIIWLVTRRDQQSPDRAMTPIGGWAPPVPQAPSAPGPSAELWWKGRAFLVPTAFVLGALFAFGLASANRPTLSQAATTTAATVATTTTVVPASTPTTTAAPTTTTTAAPTTTTMSRLTAKRATFTNPDLVTQLKDGTIVGIHRASTGGGSAYLRPDAGKEYRNFDVEICAGGDDTEVTPLQFQATMKDHTRANASLIGPVDPTLSSENLKSGDCTRGWVSFEVPAGQLAEIRFTPDLFGSAAASWAVR